MIATDVTVFTELDYLSSVEIKEDDGDVLLLAGVSRTSKVGLDMTPEEAIRIGNALADIGNEMILLRDSEIAA